MIDNILFLESQRVGESVVTLAIGNNEVQKYTYKVRPTGNVIIEYITLLISKQ